MKRRTLDFEATTQRLQFYAVEKLGEHQSITPEGFLVITDVPLCRTGVLVYGPNEVPITAGPDGVVRVYREPDEVFAETHLASIQGKSVVNDHPQDDVRPDNWKRYHVGTVLNPRRGEGALSDLVIGDMIIMDPDAIEAIKAGKREVSMGYDADYEEDTPGIGRQRNLIANHVALVEAGRCGPRCAIKDAHPSTHAGDDDMKTRDNAALKRRVKLSDEAIEQIGEILGSAAANDEESGGHTHIHVHQPNPDARTVDDESLQAFMEQNAAEHQSFDQRIAALEAKLAGAGSSKESEEEKAAKKAAEEKAAKDSEEEKAAKKAAEEKAAKDSEAEKAMEEELAEEAPPATKDQARKARDSAFLGDSFQDTIAGAEILVPGIRIPTYDAKAAAKDTLEVICGLRRRAIDLAYATSEGQQIIHGLTGNVAPDLPKMSCGEVRTLFRGAVTAKKLANNATHRTGDDRSGHRQSPTPIRTPAEHNKVMAEYWAKKQ